MNNLYTQATDLGCDIRIEEVTRIKPGKVKTVITDEGEYTCKAIIIATGCKNRLLGIDREEEFIGNGISFCVACDGAFYKDKVVCVVGGGNSAIINAISLSDVCKKVYVLQNLDYLTCEDMLKERLESKKNVEVICGVLVDEFLGDDTLTGVKISGAVDKEIDTDGVFISIGLLPQNDLFKNVVELNEQNYINEICSEKNLCEIMKNNYLNQW